MLSLLKMRPRRTSCKKLQVLIKKKLFDGKNLRFIFATKCSASRLHYFLYISTKC